MNPRRKAIVRQAFKAIDRDGSGVLDVDDIKDVYDTSHHPEVIEGKKTSRQVLNEFLANFEKTSSTDDVQITISEFERYYADISASIDEDDYFELMIVSRSHHQNT